MTFLTSFPESFDFKWPFMTYKLRFFEKLHFVENVNLAILTSFQIFWPQLTFHDFEIDKFRFWTKFDLFHLFPIFLALNYLQESIIEEMALKFHFKVEFGYFCVFLITRNSEIRLAHLFIEVTRQRYFSESLKIFQFVKD